MLLEIVIGHEFSKNCGLPWNRSLGNIGISRLDGRLVKFWLIRKSLFKTSVTFEELLNIILVSGLGRVAVQTVERIPSLYCCAELPVAGRKIRPVIAADDDGLVLSGDGTTKCADEG